MQATVPAVIVRHRGTRTAIDSLRVVAAAAAHVCNWAAAAEGRQRTERVLRALDPSAWRVLNHVGVPGGGHVDHVVVGSAGTYVIHSEAWRGVVTVDQKGATITPARDPDAAWTARGRHRSLAPTAAAVVHGLAAATGSWMPAPRAVVVVWAPFPDAVVVSGGVTYVAGLELADWLGAQPRLPDHDHLDALRTGVLTSDTSGLRRIRGRQPV